MVLSDIARGGSAIIVDCKLDKDTKCHLQNLGFVAGENVSVISRNAANVMVRIKNSKLAINTSLANNIYVEAV